MKDSIEGKAKIINLFEKEYENITFPSKLPGNNLLQNHYPLEARNNAASKIQKKWKYYKKKGLKNLTKNYKDLIKPLNIFVEKKTREIYEELNLEERNRKVKSDVFSKKIKFQNSSYNSQVDFKIFTLIDWLVLFQMLI